MSGGSRTQTVEPWEEQVEPLKYGFGEARDIYDTGPPQYYTGPTVAGFDPTQQAAQAATLGYTMGPRTQGMMKGAENALIGSLQGATPFTGGQLGNILAGRINPTQFKAATALDPSTLGDIAGQTPFTRGQYGDLLAGRVDTGQGSPYANMMQTFGNQMKSQLLGNVLPGIRSAMVEAHPGGSSVGNNIQAKAIAAANQQMMNKAAEMYGGAYAQAQGMRMPAAQLGLGAQQFGRDLGMQAYQQAQGMRMPAAQMQLGQQALGMQQYPSIMSQPFSVYDRMGDIGDKRQAMSQRAIDDDISRYTYSQQAPQNALQNYMAMISGDYGSSTTAPGPSGLDTIGKLASIASIFM
jgi:hypothetical protein